MQTWPTMRNDNGYSVRTGRLLMNEMDSCVLDDGSVLLVPGGF